MLGHFQLTEIRLLTNNPAKLDALTQAGIKVESSQRLQVGSNPLNQAYLGTKRDLMGHLLP
jgi:GTP cyclohydrolase II